MSAIGKFTSGCYLRIMLDMRLRIPELMAAHDPPLATAYALWKASKDKPVKIPMSTAHRLVTTDGAVDRIDMKTLDALAAVFGDAPLLTKAPPPPKPKPKARRKRVSR